MGARLFLWRAIVTKMNENNCAALDKIGLNKRRLVKKVDQASCQTLFFKVIFSVLRNNFSIEKWPLAH